MGKETGRAARRAGLATQWSQEKKEAVVKAKKQQENKSKKRAAPQDDEEEWETDEDDKKNTQAKKARKAAVGPEQSESEEEDDDSEEDDSDFGVDLSRLDDESDSDSESEIEADEIEEKKPAAAAATAGGDKMEVDEDEEEDDDEEEEIDVDELSVDGEDEETVAATSRVRETINNKEGLLAALRRFQLDTTPGSVPFAMHQCVVSKKVTADAIESVDDDLARELAFMNQSLEAARTARTLLKKEGVPFTRPTDYFAEMIRTDETMEKVKAKMIEDATAKKASAEAKKQRDLKKFGKQVQVAKQQERAKQKREVLNKIDLLKKSTFPPVVSPDFHSDRPMLTKLPENRARRRLLGRPWRNRGRRPLRRGCRQ